MNWLIWRQHRKQWLFLALFLALFAAAVIPTGAHYWQAYQDALANCATTDSCGTLRNTLFQNDQVIFHAITFIGLAAPIMLGVFLGAPLLAKEYEDGTNKLIWTQGVSRRKWLTLKLLWVLSFATLYGVAMTLLVTWWSRTGNALYQFRFTPAEFGVQGYMPVVYSLFATALGIVVGAWFRRVMLALAVTLAVLVVVQVGVAYGIRSHYAQPVTVNRPLSSSEGDFPNDDSWVVYRSMIDNHGKAIDGISPNTVPKECKDMREDKMTDCLNSLGYHGTTTYQPADRYWRFQLIEALMYLGSAGAAVAATYWLVLRRDA